MKNVDHQSSISNSTLIQLLQFQALGEKSSLLVCVTPEAATEERWLASHQLYRILWEVVEGSFCRQTRLLQSNLDTQGNHIHLKHKDNVKIIHSITYLYITLFTISEVTSTPDNNNYNNNNKIKSMNHIHTILLLSFTVISKLMEQIVSLIGRWVQEKLKDLLKVNS